MNKGKLYLIPTILGEDNHQKTLPYFVTEIIKDINIFIVENIRTVNECLVKEFIIDNDTKMIMFVKLSKGSKINEKLIDYIKKQIKNKLSPKHVPSKIIQVKDIPKTKTGKIVELAVKNIINGKKVENIKSLSNPESLKDFTNRKEIVF